MGDGTNCEVFEMPWFEGALQCRPQVPMDRHLKVSQLVKERVSGALRDLLSYLATLSP